MAIAIDIESIIERLGGAGTPGENTGSLPVPVMAWRVEENRLLDPRTKGTSHT